MKGRITRWAGSIFRGDKTVEVRYNDIPFQICQDRKATGMAVHLTVALPFGQAAAINQRVGYMQVLNASGDLHLEAANGRIDVKQLHGALHVLSEGADVSVGLIQGNTVDIRTGSGNMKLLQIRAEQVLLQTDAGIIDGTNLSAGDLSIESLSGPVRLTGAEPTTALIETESGDVDLSTHLRRTRRTSVRSASGNVVLRVGKWVGFDLLAETKSGEVKLLGMSLDVIERDGQVCHLRQGPGGIDLQVAAGGGTLTVRPYDASRLDILIGDAESSKALKSYGKSR
jgi:hypothetical protein